MFNGILLYLNLREYVPVGLDGPPNPWPYGDNIASTLPFDLQRFPLQREVCKFYLLFNIRDDLFTSILNSVAFVPRSGGVYDPARNIKLVQMTQTCLSEKSNI